MRIKKLFLASSVVGASLALAACNSPAADEGSDAEGLTSLEFRVDWVYGAQHTGYMVADKLGFYEDAGLDVTVMEGEGSSVTAQIVSSGQADMGVISAGEVLASISNGLELRAVATLVQHSPTAIIYNADRVELNSLEDLYGVDLGVATSSSQYNEWRAVAARNDVDMSQINEVAGGTAVLPSFVNGEFDAALGWTFLDGAVAQAADVNVEYLLLSDFGMEVPNSSLVANVDFLESNPEAVTRFIEETERGWNYAEENPDAALEIFFDTAPEADVESNAARLPLFLEYMGEDFGAFDEENWQALYDMYESEGLLSQEIELEGEAYDTGYLP